jgi:exopolysaccharide biosynthesis polyprenyl glycosylphosphotransferase
MHSGFSLDRRHLAGPRIAAWQLLALADVAVASMLWVVLPPKEAVLFGGTLLLGLAARGCYRARFTSQLGAMVSQLVTTVAVAAVVTGAVSPTWAVTILRLVPLIALAILAGRGLAGAAIRTLRREAPGEPTLIVGAGAVGARVAANLIDHPEYGLSPIGIIDDILDEDLPLPLLGDTTQLEQVARAFDVRHVVVTFGRADEARMVEVLRTCHGLDSRVWVVPRLFELGTSMKDADELWGVPVGELSRSALRTSQWRLKRAFDVAVAGALVAVTAPVMLAIALTVKLTSPGPVFFRQRRIGQHGRTVDVLKFRTMTVNDDSDRTWNVTSDPRVTAIGRILRPTSLDELPQLINVLRGDMSLVGPRPERPHFVDLFSDAVPGYSHRHRVPVGLTGLSQVNGLRGDTSISDRAVFDNIYIDNWSLWSDLVILFRTAVAVVRPPKSVVIEVADVVEPADHATVTPIIVELAPADGAVEQQLAI